MNDLASMLRRSSPWFAGGLVITRLARARLNNWRREYGLEPLQDVTIHAPALRGSAVLWSVMEPTNPMSHIVMGLSAGSLVDTVTHDLMQMYRVQEQRGVGEITDADKRLPYRRWDVRTVNIPWWVPKKLQYAIMVHHIRNLIMRDTYNRVTKEMVPAGFRHPATVWTARKIIRDAGIDGRDAIGCGKAVTDWCWENLTYVLDPEGDFEGSDFYMHPALVIDQANELGEIEVPGIKAEDCDTINAIVPASLLIALGHKVRLLLWAEETPGTYSHVTCALYLPDAKKASVPHSPYWNLETTDQKVISRREYDFWPPHVSMGFVKLNE